MPRNLPPLPPPPRPPKDWSNAVNISLFIVISFALVFLSYQHYIATGYCENLVNYGDRAKMYSAIDNKTVIYNTKLEGVYSYSSDIYCIWNSTKESNEDSESHEYCHYLIDEGKCFNKAGEKVSCKEHFCGDGW